MIIANEMTKQSGFANKKLFFITAPALGPKFDNMDAKLDALMHFTYGHLPHPIIAVLRHSAGGSYIHSSMHRIYEMRCIYGGPV